MTQNASDALVYNDIQVRNLDEYLNLTDMWKAAGSPSSRTPNDWQSLPQAIDFVGYIAEITGKSGNNPLTFTKRGRSGGTWAHWQIGLAYAKYLSPEFHSWCNQVVRARMEGKLIPISTTSLSVQDIEQLTERFSRQTQQIVAPIVDSLHVLTDRVGQLEKKLPQQRRPIKVSTQNLLNNAMVALGRRCPCCRLVDVVTEDGTVLNAEFDHFYSNQLPTEKHSWLICKTCHRDLTDGKMLRTEADAHFRSFQLHLSKLSKNSAPSQ